MLNQYDESSKDRGVQVFVNNHNESPWNFNEITKGMWESRRKGIVKWGGQVSRMECMYVWG